MISNPLSIAEMALNLGVNLCFGLHDPRKAGFRANSLKWASALSLIAFFVSLFGSGGAPQANTCGVTSDELKDDLDRLRANLDHDFFVEKQTDYLSEMQDKEATYKHVWNALCSHVAQDQGDPDSDHAIEATWAKYADPLDNEVRIEHRTLVLCNWIANHPGQKFQTLSLYLLAGGLYLNMCQLLITKTLNEIQTGAIRPGSSYSKAYAQWRDVDHPAWKASHDQWRSDARAAANAPPPGFRGLPGRGHVGIFSSNDPPPYPEPVPPQRPPMPPESLSDLAGTEYGQFIRDNVDKLIAYADPIVTLLEAADAQQTSTESALKAAVTVAATSDGLAQVNYTALGILGHKVPQGLADAQRTYALGVIDAGIAANPPEALAFGDTAAIAQARATIDGWKTCRDNFA